MGEYYVTGADSEHETPHASSGYVEDDQGRSLPYIHLLPPPPIQKLAGKT